MNRSTRTILGAAAALALLLPGAAGAQEGGSKRKSVRGKGDIKVNQYGRGGSGGGGSVDLGVAEIEGRIFKPSVFFVLARSDFQYQAIAFRTNFTDRIVDEAKRRPF
jgi:hypothetical protein